MGAETLPRLYYIGPMTRLFALPLALLLLTQPVRAEEETGLSLMERGARLLMEGLLQEMEPALEGLDELAPTLRDFAQEMGPALAELMNEIKDWSAYHPPEVLPNGDIIIRRKSPPPPDVPQDQIDI